MKVKNLFKNILKFLLFCTIIAIIIVGVIFTYCSINLPKHSKLEDYKPPVTSRVYSNNGILLKEYAIEKRLFVSIEDIPEIVKHAFISAEDKNFYKNSGLDIESIISAFVYNIYAYFRGLQFRGGSTITQQVVKNMLLTNERTIQRKIKEAILAIRITKDFGKDKILELYLNHIFLGNNSYGVASAALNYFDKSLDELTVEDAALLAAMPKAPGKINPITNYDKAIARRNWVLERMEKDGYINKEQLKKALQSKIELKKRIKSDDYFNYGAFVEEVRKNVVNKFGEESLMRDGLVITSTIDPFIQNSLNKALKDGLEQYDRRHGYRGALGNIFDNKETFNKKWPNLLKNFEIKEYYRNNWQRAVVLDFDDKNQKVLIGLLKNENMPTFDHDEITIIDDLEVKKSYMSFNNTKWAIDASLLDKKEFDSNGNEIKIIHKVDVIRDVNLRIGDVIFVEGTKDDGYLLKQTPIVNGAAIAIDPHNGRILGMVGGYIDSESNFNRATQAKRQPGSAIKPFVYLTAFENGYSPSDTIMDEEIALYQGPNLPLYRPRNFDNKFHGLITLRKALQNSYNVSTVRLAEKIGLRKITQTIRNFGINKRPRRFYSVVLGSIETHLIDMVRAYAMLINGGKYIELENIEKIHDKYGNTIFKRDKRSCDNCIVKEKDINNIRVPFLNDERKSITDAASAYQVTYILEGAVKYGTAWRARNIGKPVGAKTGTSNDFKDAWFIGFSPDFVVGVYIGFDDNRSLGEGETGSKAAAPTFTEAMQTILNDKPSVPFRIPDNITFKKIDVSTGKEPTLASNKNSIILEAFKTNMDNINKDDKKNNVSLEILNEFGIDIDSIDNAENEEYIINNSEYTHDENKENNDNENNKEQANKKEYLLDDFINMDF